MQQIKKTTNHPIALLLILAVCYSCCHVCFSSRGTSGLGVVTAFTTFPRRDGVVTIHAKSAINLAISNQSNYRNTISMGGIMQEANIRGTSIHKRTGTMLYMGRVRRPSYSINSTVQKQIQQLQNVSLSFLMLQRQKHILHKVIQRFKLAMAVFVTSFFLCLGPVHNLSLLGGGCNHRPPVAHASTLTATVSPASGSPTTTSTMDKIVQQYVQRHMFQDDMYDPVESTYREIIHDATTQRQYSKSLTSTLGSILGKKTVAESTRESTSSDGQVIKFLLKLVDTIQEKSGLSKSVIIPALFFVGGGIPVVMILAALMSFSYSQKAMTERMAIQRYGESVLEAEEMVVRDDDEENEDEDDEDENGDDDNDEDDDDDDEDEVKDKKKK